MVGSLGFLSGALRNPERMSSAISAIPVLGLLGLALAGTVSLLWTTVELETAILLALTPAALAGVAVFAACDPILYSRGEIVGVWLSVLAISAAATGLIGVILEVEPWAIQLAGRWRPAGFVEYPPALALLQLAAMPVLARFLIAARGLPRALSGSSIMIAAAMVFLAQSRVVLALAGLLVAAWVAWPDHTLGRTRREAIYPTFLWITGGFLLAVVIRLLDGWAAAALCAVLLLALPKLMEAILDRIRLPETIDGSQSRRATGAVAATVLVVGLLTVLVLPALSDPSSQGSQGGQGADHGRIELWKNSLPAMAERPLRGHGQGSFLDSTLR